MSVHWKPDDTPTISTALPGGARLIDFMTKVFGARVARRYDTPGGGVAHAEIRLGESLVMTGDPMGEHVIPPGAVQVYVPDSDAAYARALEAGATSKEEPSDKFYGDRSARVIDSSGNQWSISTHKEDLSEEELQRRVDAMMK